MSLLNKITSTMAVTLISGVMLFAQTEVKQENVSDEELKQFAGAFQQVQVLTQTAQQEMVEVIQSEGLTVEEYNSLSQAAQNPNQEVEVSEEKMDKFKETSIGINKIQVAAQEKMQKEIVNSGLTIKRYQEIAAKLQTDKELQQKIQQHMPSNG